MTATLAPAPRKSLAPAFAAAAGLAAAMGVGRFVYTPLLPVMVDAHQISAHDGAMIATANYAGYLLGAILLTRWPELNSRNTFRIAAGLLVLSELLMAAPAPALFPAALRLIAGVTSAVIFVACAGVAARPGSSREAAGIAFGGVGFGIALTGVLVLAVRPFLGWQSMWLVSAVLTAVLLLPAWRLDIRPGLRARKATIRSTGAWRALLVAYFLEGLGYIVIGTFLVAAVSDERGPVVGSAIWVVVGAAAVPATVLWGVAARRWSPAVAMPIALVAQCVSAVLPAVSGAVVPAVISAALFGATFLGIVMLAMRIGGELSDDTAAAPLTAVYGAGQMLGPLVVAPVIGDSYPAAFVIAALVLAAATIAAGVVTRLIRRT
ncbi:YbfB/YjiJ family MFS transporter [Nocardia sp. NPDC049149]|uniref:YbfB/YjiJ family MFS transporter n=1 Tax=Nocardia sp. NPDC049149 TaxID=3364315 RepID=UPI00371CE0B5